jgi:hypothetical protein
MVLFCAPAAAKSLHRNALILHARKRQSMYEQLLPIKDVIDFRLVV